LCEHALIVASDKISRLRDNQGDLLLVTQNNESGIMNGDLVKIIDIGERVRRANLTFINLQVEKLVTKKTFSKLLIEEIVYQNGINLTKEQLFIKDDFYLE
jgi:hypothetical protein